MAAAGTRLNRILTLSLVSPGLHYQGSGSTQKKQEYGVKVEVRHYIPHQRFKNKTTSLLQGCYNPIFPLVRFSRGIIKKYYLSRRVTSYNLS